jgi:drug/metabolite transporter (DMT)-like permease
MKWVWLLISVIAATFGDLMTAKGMSEHGEPESFGARGLSRIGRHILTHKIVVAGVFFDALAFFGLMALLSVAPVSFAVPASAASYIIKVAVAHSYLGERVDRRRWLGAMCVVVGIVLISL